MSERRCQRGYEGQGMVEYGVILLFVSIAVVAIVAFLGPPVSNLIMGAANGFPGS